MSNKIRVSRREEDFDEFDLLVKKAKKYKTHIYNLNPIPSGMVIGDNCVIHLDVKIGDDVTIERGVHVGRGAIIGNNVTLGEFCRIGRNVTLPDDCSIEKTLKIEDDIDLTNTIEINNVSRHPVTYLGKGKMAIGCITHLIDWWLDNFQDIGEDNGYSQNEIDEYHSFMKRMKEFDETGNIG